MNEPDERVVDIEQAFVTHWRHFGLYPGADLRDEDGVLRFESPIAHLPYNAVIRTAIPDTSDADAVIARTAASFRTRDVPFMWVQRPSDRPLDLARRLAMHGLDLVETATGMDLELGAWGREPDRSDARLVDIGADEIGLLDYEELIRTYWSVPETERHLIQTLNRHWTGARNPGIRLVAYFGGAAVGKLFMNTEELPAKSRDLRRGSTTRSTRPRRRNRPHERGPLTGRGRRSPALRPPFEFHGSGDVPPDGLRRAVPLRGLRHRSAVRNPPPLRRARPRATTIRSS